MDIPALSMAMAQDRVMTDFGVAMLANSIDIAEESGEELTKMMEMSVNPDLGRNVDIVI